jgi:YidC/Oxa1 family membrane protein insertase
VNETKSRLAPLLAEINRQFKGEERHRRTLELYRQQGVSPAYTFRSLASAAIQVPIFFAAYHMLHENVELAGVGFLWVRDLAFPDHAVLLPFAIPFFGRYLNLLPLAMTALTLLTSWIHRDRSLSPDLHRRQQVNLYLMALAFLALFYTFPAGMVLYWTTNNLLALLVAVGRRTRRDART